MDHILVEKIVQATICLHNYLCLTENANHAPAGFVDREDSSGNIISSAASNPNFSPIAFQIFILINLFFIVLRKFVVNCRIFLHIFHKERCV